MSHPFDPTPEDRPGFDPSWPPLRIGDGGFEDNEDRPPTAAAIVVVTFLLLIVILCGGVIWWIW